MSLAPTVAFACGGSAVIDASSTTFGYIGSSAFDQGGQVGGTAIFPAGASLSLYGHTYGDTAGNPSGSALLTITVSPGGFHWSGAQPSSPSDRISSPALAAGTYTVTFTGASWTIDGKCPPPCTDPPCPNTPAPNYDYAQSEATYTVVMTTSETALALAKADAQKAQTDAMRAASEAAALKKAIGSAGLGASAATEARGDASDAENDANESVANDSGALSDLGDGDDSGATTYLHNAETDANDADSEFGDACVAMRCTRGGSHDAQAINDATTGESDAQAASTADDSGYLAMISVRGGSHD
jgi:hypothetical protein